MKKSLIAIILALVLCTPVAAFAGENQEPEFLVGYPGMPPMDITMAAMDLNREAVVAAAGGGIITEAWDFTPEGTVTDVEKLIERGVKGIIVTPTDESILPAITNMCEEAGVYWCISMRPILNDEIREIVYASDYYVGYVQEPGEILGAGMAQIVAERGAKTYAMLTGSVGDSDADTREAGIARVAEEYGMECVATIRNPETTADFTAAVESIVSANPDIDAIFLVSTLVAGSQVAVAEAIEELGLSGKVMYVPMFPVSGCEKYFENGTITGSFGSMNEFDSVIAAAMVANAVAGTPLSDEKLEFNLSFTPINNAEDFNTYLTYYSTDTAPLYSVEEAKELWIGQPLEKVQELIDNFTMESIIARKDAQ